MIVGLGTDIVENSRFENLSRRFLEKVYTEDEIKILNGKVFRLAGNFAAKEAVSKALGTGFSGLIPKEIEILRDKNGSPVCRLHGNAEKTAKMSGIERIIVSISHSKCYAAATAVAERKENNEGYDSFGNERN